MDPEMNPETNPEMNPEMNPERSVLGGVLAWQTSVVGSDFGKAEGELP